MRFALLASGSGGNAMVIEHDGYALLLDAGISLRETLARMASAGMEGVRPAALLLSHEHSDHSHCAGILARKYRMPVYATRGTAGSCTRALGKIPAIRHLENGSSIEIGPFRVSAQRLPHDAEDPSGYVIEWSDGRLGVATDLGSWGEWLVQGFRNCTALVIEFNHDLGMLWDGSYPWHLKQRIASSNGHLCNADAALLLDRLSHAGLERVVLAHLSRENNRPEIAHRAAQAILGAGRRLLIGDQFVTTPMVEL
jgi:phosphoribosyl 1,2-cyclic phosphodiesterase